MLWLSDPRGDPPVFEIDVVLLRPRSRGTVRLRSVDPTEPPSIALPNMSDPFDVERLAEGYRRGHEVASRPELRRLCDATPSPGTRGPEELPGFDPRRGVLLPPRRGHLLNGLGTRRRRRRRFSGTRPRHRAVQRGRRVDRSQRTFRVHPHPDSYARRAALGTDRHLAIGATDTSIRAIAATPARTDSRPAPRKASTTLATASASQTALRRASATAVARPAARRRLISRVPPGAAADGGRAWAGGMGSSATCRSPSRTRWRLPRSRFYWRECWGRSGAACRPRSSCTRWPR